VDVRWLPILAAALGVLGGVLGALVGGTIANNGQKDRFESERAAAIQDLRVEAYSDYVGAAEQISVALQGTFPDAEKRAAIQRVVTAGARVLLVTDENEVRKATEETTNALAEWDEAQTKLLDQQATDGEADQPTKDAAKKKEDTYRDAIDHFLDVVQAEIDATEG
jgi:hypothetical protein